MEKESNEGKEDDSQDSVNKEGDSKEQPDDSSAADVAFLYKTMRKLTRL